MNESQYSKCELLEELKRRVKHAYRRGCKVVSLEENDVLEIMRYDQRGGVDELSHVLNEIDVACGCRHTKYSENHSKRVAFVC